MQIIVLYIGICIIGGFVGNYMAKRGKRVTWTSKLQMALTAFLLFLMGVRLGADQNVIARLGTIGVTALIFTAFVFLGSVLAVMLAMRLLNIDDEGEIR